MKEASDTDSKANFIRSTIGKRDQQSGELTDKVTGWNDSVEWIEFELKISREE